MKSRLVLALVAGVFLHLTISIYGDSEPLDCAASFSLGEYDANRDAERRPSGRWLTAGWGITSALGVIGFMMAIEEENDPIFLYSAIGAGVGLGISILAPMAIVPNPFVMPDESDVDLDCYLRGYTKTARTQNTGAAIVGSLLGVGTVAVVGVSIAAVAVVGGIILIIYFLNALG